ncbi:hypothetical protein BHM03_00025619, partial [Ensete ventricosum]
AWLFKSIRFKVTIESSKREGVREGDYRKPDLVNCVKPYKPKAAVLHAYDPQGKQASLVPIPRNQFPHPKSYLASRQTPSKSYPKSVPTSNIIFGLKKRTRKEDSRFWVATKSEQQ